MEVKVYTSFENNLLSALAFSSRNMEKHSGRDHSFDVQLLAAFIHMHKACSYKMT